MDKPTDQGRIAAGDNIYIQANALEDGHTLVVAGSVLVSKDGEFVPAKETPKQ